MFHVTLNIPIHAANCCTTLLVAQKYSHLFYFVHTHIRLMHTSHILHKACKITGYQVVWVATFGTVCRSSVWHLLQMTPLAPIILRWLLDFWKISLTLP